MKVVMVEFIDNNNEWAWCDVIRNTTPRQAILDHISDNVDELPENPTFIEEGDFGGNPMVYCKEYEDVRAYYITI